MIPATEMAKISPWQVFPGGTVEVVNSIDDELRNMKRLLALLMMVGLLLGMSGCGIDSNIFEAADWIDDVF